MDEKKLNSDRQRIMDLGGPTSLARKLNFGKGGPQRVQNWLARGIPAEVKLAWPDLFLPHLVKEDVEQAVTDLLAGKHR